MSVTIDGRVTLIAGVGLRILCVALSVLLLFAVDFYFGASAAGFYQTFVAYTLFFAGIGTLGFQYVGIAEASQSQTRAKITFSFAAISGMFFAGLGWIVFLGMKGTMPAIVCWGGLACIQVIAAYAKVNNMVLRALLFENAAPYILFATSVMLVSLGWMKSDGEHGEFSAAFSLVSIYLFSIVHLVSVFYLRSKLGLSFGYGLRHLRYMFLAFRERAKHNLVTIVSSLLFNRVELFVFGALGMFAEAGLFAMALIVGNIASMPHNFASSIFVPKFVQYLRANNLAGARSLFCRSRRSVSVATTFLCILIVGGAICYSEFVSKLDMSFLFCIVLVSAGNMLTSFSGFFHYGLMALGHEKECARVNVLAATANVFVGVLMVIEYNAVGACISIFLTHLIKAALGFVSIRKSQLYQRVS